MIWADILTGFDAEVTGAAGAYLGWHKNPNLMNAMIANNGLAACPELRSDALLFGGGVEAVRFMRKRIYSGDAGYLCFVQVNGAAGVVARCDRLKEVKYYQFFQTETVCLNFVESLKKRGALVVGARVSIECLDSEAAIGLGQPEKVRAYAKFKAANTDKYRAGKAVDQAVAGVALAGGSVASIAAQNHAVAWLNAAISRHAAARAEYVALGGLVDATMGGV